MAASYISRSCQLAYVCKTVTCYCTLTQSLPGQSPWPAPYISADQKPAKIPEHDYILECIIYIRVHFQTFPALSTPPQTKDWSGVSVVSELTSGVILKPVNHMMERFQEDMQKLPEVCKS